MRFRDDSDVGLSSHNAPNTQHNAPMPRLPAFLAPRVPLGPFVYGRPPCPPPHLPHLHLGVPSHIPSAPLLPPSAARIHPHPIYANQMASNAQLGLANRPPFSPQNLGMFGLSGMAADTALQPKGSCSKGNCRPRGTAGGA
ncbi:unnamed protein product [Vitrella brassicaformis CCMP3155]|uniref:Uncharacterized protein n=1 Tax=Vitrella brassicaformis (strain CCMP3155) TaxID=1169540 RepID=A0A0G4EIU7_VITBC|nr:unnamed protein product [Vitrella brassicaformis CCMP3155]|eukprot:CEL95946.1 unnamed protein product [Vitrella brassicaformis CCMP3155]